MLIHAIFTLLRGGSVDFTSVMMSILAVLFVMFAILPLHEYAHAWMANKLGDSTALQAGRHTINPLASFDPLGALFLLLFGFGWAKPVPVDPRRFKNPRRDMALTALAGPVSNILAALVGALLYLAVAIFAFHYVVPDWLFYFFSYYITVNASLAVFNLLPLPPLDGSKVVGCLFVRPGHVPVLPVPKPDHAGGIPADLFWRTGCAAFIFAVGPDERDFLSGGTSLPFVWSAVNWKRSRISWKASKGRWIYCWH